MWYFTWGILLWEIRENPDSVKTIILQSTHLEKITCTGGDRT